MDEQHQIDGYEIGQALGAGGMGTVYEARQLSPERTVAIKILAAEHTHDPRALERFRREAKAAAEIDHENVVQIFGSGTTASGAPFIAMELLPGQNLAVLLRAEGPLPWARVRALALQAAAALEAAHRKGIVHRDVKPANCIVAPLPEGGERLKVCDFGIAKQFGSAAEQQLALTRPGTIVGSTRYMAPEQFTTGHATLHSDIYALGIVLHELLVGVPPFKSKNPMEVVTMHVRDAPPRISSLRPEVSEAVSDFVLTCLAKMPEDRFASMTELREALLALPTEDAGPVDVDAALDAGARARSIPPTEVLDEAALAPPTPPAAFTDDAPRPRRREGTRDFAQTLETERETSSVWVIVVLVLAALALALVFAL